MYAQAFLPGKFPVWENRDSTFPQPSPLGGLESKASGPIVWFQLDPQSPFVLKFPLCAFSHLNDHFQWSHNPAFSTQFAPSA